MNTKTCPDPPGCRNSFKFKNTLIGLLALLCLLLAIPAQIRAENLIKEDTKTDDKNSQWLFTPVLSSNPKLSTAGGGMAAYMYQFDEHSPASIMGGTATYSTTDSYYYGIFAKLHFGRDDHRLLGGIGKGKVRNNYDDFLGSGLPVQTTDDLDVLALRYYKRIKGNWYLGPQGISTNYAISGDNWLSGKIIELIGMTGFKSNGLGLALQYDSRDNQNSPSSGQVFQLHNIAYRQSLGGETSFDAYHADYKFFLGHGKDHVLAFHIQGRWSHNAPSSGYSSVGLRGYVRGQYLAPHMTMMEIEERFSLNKKWGLVAFGGVAGLYGNDRNRDLKADLFPAGGGGISYLLNDEKMVVRAEYAIGKEGNQGFYMTFGQPF